MRITKKILIAFIALLSFLFCFSPADAKSKRHSKKPKTTKTVKKSKKKKSGHKRSRHDYSPPVIAADGKEHGKGCYYGRGTTGARTASGEIFDSEAFICAHKTYPFGTKLKVTNLKNGKTVVVRVIDRGPFGRGRIVDLSYAAARELDMIRSGTADVTLEIVKD